MFTEVEKYKETIFTIVLSVNLVIKL